MELIASASPVPPAETAAETAAVDPASPASALQAPCGPLAARGHPQTAAPVVPAAVDGAPVVPLPHGHGRPPLPEGREQVERRGSRVVRSEVTLVGARF